MKNDRSYFESCALCKSLNQYDINLKMYILQNAERLASLKVLPFSNTNK